MMDFEKIRVALAKQSAEAQTANEKAEELRLLRQSVENLQGKEISKISITYLREDRQNYSVDFSDPVICKAAMALAAVGANRIKELTRELEKFVIIKEDSCEI